MDLNFQHGALSLDGSQASAFLTFHPANLQYETNLKFLNSFPDVPYKSPKRKAKYVAEILGNMNKNGIALSSLK